MSAIDHWTDDDLLNVVMLLDSARRIIRDYGRMSGRPSGEVVDRWLTDSGDFLAGIPCRRYGLVAVEPRDMDILLESLEQMSASVAENMRWSTNLPESERRIDMDQSKSLTRLHREVRRAQQVVENG